MFLSPEICFGEFGSLYGEDASLSGFNSYRMEGCFAGVVGFDIYFGVEGVGEPFGYVVFFDVLKAIHVGVESGVIVWVGVVVAPFPFPAGGDAIIVGVEFRIIFFRVGVEYIDFGPVGNGIAVIVGLSNGEPDFEVGTIVMAVAIGIIEVIVASPAAGFKVVGDREGVTFLFDGF